jgi:hypothetical protein
MDAANLEVAADSGPVELKAIYQENLGYDVDNDSVANGRFIKACRAILALPIDTNNAVEGVRFNRDLIADQLNDAIKWRNTNISGRRKRPRVFIPDTRVCR